jgi:hypothetical protein
MVISNSAQTIPYSEMLDVQHLFFSEVCDSRCHSLRHDSVAGWTFLAIGIMHSQKTPDFVGNSFRLLSFDIFYGVDQHTSYRGH